MHFSFKLHSFIHSTCLHVVSSLCDRPSFATVVALLNRDSRAGARGGSGEQSGDEERLPSDLLTVSLFHYWEDQFAERVAGTIKEMVEMNLYVHLLPAPSGERERDSQAQPLPSAARDRNRRVQRAQVALRGANLSAPPLALILTHLNDFRLMCRDCKCMLMYEYKITLNSTAKYTSKYNI